MHNLGNTARNFSVAARFFSFFGSNKWWLLLVPVPLLTVPLRAQRWIFANLGTPVRYVTSYYDAFGLMIRVNNGNILNFYREGTTHASDRGVMMLRVTSDNGSTLELFFWEKLLPAGRSYGLHLQRRNL